MIPSVTQYGATPRPASSSWVVPNRTATPVASVLAHKRLAMTLVAVVSLVGLAAAMLSGRKYVAEATIRISPVVPAAVNGEETRFNSNDEYRDFVQEQVFEIDNYATVTAALDLLGPKRSLWQDPDESDRLAAERLMDALKVQPVPDSYLIKIGLGGSTPYGIADIVNAVAKSYLSRAAKRELDGADVGVQLLTSRRTEVEKNIASDQQQLAGLTQELGVSSVGSGLVNPYDKMLADSNAALARARRNVLLAQAHLDAVRSHRARIKDADVEAKAQQMAASGSETTTARQQLIQEREQALIELSGLGPNHPGRSALQAQIATINKELSKLDASSLDRARSMLSDSEQATTSVDLSEAESDLEQMQSAEKGIEKELEGVKFTAATFGSKYGQAVTVHEKLERERKDLQDLEERVSLLRLKTESPGVVALESAAMVPDLPLKSTKRLIFALFGLTALILGIAVPTAIDLIDGKIKTADEFEGILGFPPLGVALGSNGSDGRETLRRIALGIMREWRTSGIRSFILTSVREGSTANLSLALADELTELGVRALAVEVSLSGPNPGQPRPPLTGPGVGSIPARVTKRLVPKVAKTGVLDATGQLAAQSRDTNIQRPQNGISRRFGYVRETIDRALGNHDIVLLSTPPLLASADTVALIQMPAGAILVARAGRDVVTEIAAAARELERCVPPVVGAIICGDAHHSGDDEALFDLAVDNGNSPATRFSYGVLGK
jgi:polysaccharide biosynthesis transport protein